MQRKLDNDLGILPCKVLLRQSPKARGQRAPLRLEGEKAVAGAQFCLPLTLSQSGFVHSARNPPQIDRANTGIIRRLAPC